MSEVSLTISRILNPSIGVNNVLILWSLTPLQMQVMPASVVASSADFFSFLAFCFFFNGEAVK